MPYNLTGVNQTYNTASKFGQSLNGGYGYTTAGPVTTYPLTLRATVKAASSGNIEVIGGRGGAAWLGKAANNTALAHFGSGSAGTGSGNDITMSSTVNIADGAWHELELNVSANGVSTFFVDGVLASSSNSVTPTFTPNNTYFGIRAFFNTANSSTPGFQFTGEVDQFAVFSDIQHTAAYTPSSSAMTGSEPGLVALYSLDGNLNDSVAATAATALTLSAPSTSAVGTAITVTVGLNGTKGTATTVSLTAVDGTFNPASVTVPANGTATSQYTPASTGAKTLTATDDAAGLAAATATTTASAAVSPFDQTKVFFSPGNWLVGTSSAKSNNDGAYFRFGFTGAACTLNFDMTNNVAPHAILQYRVDGTGPWNAVTLAASVALSIPSETSAWAQHFVEVEIRQTSEAVSRWSPQSTAVVLVGITLAGGGALLAKPPKRALTAFCYGDSIFNGINALTNSGDSTVRGHAQQSYMNLIMKRLGFDFGMIAFGGQGWVTTGGGSVPVFPTTWNYLWSGQTRDFTTIVPDFLIICHGQNDGTNATTTQVTSVLNGMIAATPRTTKIVVLMPLSGRQDANLRAGIAACSDPARVQYVDTTGWFTPANSLDSVHPLGWEHHNNIARIGLEALRPILQPVKGTRSARTISLTLVADAAGTVPRANLTGITGAIFDQQSPGALTIAADNFTNGTTDGNGLFTQTVYTTLGAGQQVWLDMASADKAMAFKGLVTLS